MLPRINVLYNIPMELSGISDSSISRTTHQPVQQTAAQQMRNEQPQAVNRNKTADKTVASNEPVVDKVTLSGKGEDDPQVKAVAEKMKAVEEKVKAHEAAHKAAGGNLAGPATFSYTQGPDGRSYITGGEVQINISGGKTPEETISRMQQVIRAALAPADPSGQDRAVAAQAASQIARAQQQKMQEDDPSATQKPGSLNQTSDMIPPEEATQGAGQGRSTASEKDRNRNTAGQAVANQARNAYASMTPQGTAQNSPAAAGPALQSISSFA